MDTLGGKDLFKQPDLDFVREAWVAAEFGEKRGASSVRLIAEDRPDLALRFKNDEIEIYELVEVDHVDRRRGDEYASLAKAKCRTYHWPSEHWATGEQALTSIRFMAEKKAKRAAELAANEMPYPEQTRLLFYVNLGDFGAHTDEIESVFSIAVEPARQWFPTIWILWKSNIYLA